MLGRHPPHSHQYLSLMQRRPQCPVLRLKLPDLVSRAHPLNPPTHDSNLSARLLRTNPHRHATPHQHAPRHPNERPHPATRPPHPCVRADPLPHTPTAHHAVSVAPPPPTRPCQTRQRAGFPSPNRPGEATLPHPPAPAHTDEVGPGRPHPADPHRRPPNSETPTRATLNTGQAHGDLTAQRGSRQLLAALAPPPVMLLANSYSRRGGPHAVCAWPLLASVS